jgi:hypothetical protein
MKKVLMTALGCCLMLAAGRSTAGAVAEKAGTTTGEFLRLAAGARPAAMGEAFTALADDVNSLYFNPAGLAGVHERQALLSHTMWFVDVNHDYAAFVQPLGCGAIGGSFTYLSTTFEKRAGDTESPDSNGNVGESALALSYGRQLGWGVAGGVTVKYISSNLDGTTAGSPAFDVGLRKTFRGDTIAVGLAARNLGGSLDYGSGAVAVGNAAIFGVASKGLWVKNLSLGLDTESVINNDAFSVNFGAEYLWNVARDWTIDPRAGFKSNGSVVTAGIGIGFKSYQFDYALDSQASLGLANRLSFGIKF